MKILSIIFLSLALFSCTTKKIEYRYVQKQTKKGTVLKLTEKDLPPLVTKLEVFKLCRANALCKYSKLTKEWEIKDYSFYEKGEFFLHNEYIYDYTTMSVRYKKYPDKIFGRKDWADQASTFSLEGRSAENE